MISNWKSRALVLFNVLKRVYHKNIFIKQELINSFTINFLSNADNIFFGTKICQE
jgi:hypothetical protein